MNIFFKSLSIKFLLFLSLFTISHTHCMLNNIKDTDSILRDNYKYLSLNRTLNDNLYFASALLVQKKVLIDFAIDSNDIYQTRTADRSVAEEVFDIDEMTFLHGVVEVLKLGEEIVGFFTLKMNTNTEHDTCELGHLFVKSGMQKRGLGGMLFERAIEFAKARGFKQMVWISDPDSKEFYLKKGAHITGYDENLLNLLDAVPLFAINLL